MREIWVEALRRMCMPVLESAASDRLRATMPVFRDGGQQQYLEAIGRILCGIGPWLALPVDNTLEGRQRAEVHALAVCSLQNLVDPKAADYFDFGAERQALVDAAYLAQGLLRCPSLFHSLGSIAQEQLIVELKKTRQVVPPNSNWLLFAAMVETFLLIKGEEVVATRLMPFLERFISDYYVGDGMYGDGPHFHCDYYNSFVIHPMLTDILDALQYSDSDKTHSFRVLQRARHCRYAAVLERTISPSGTWPVFGRTLVCRIGAFHALSHAALKGLLPEGLDPAQVRCGLNAVLNTFLASTKNFDPNGFLTVGINGDQPDSAEHYISAGSPYHSLTFFAALGLTANADFWSKPDSTWTSVRAFSGDRVMPDHAYDEHYGGKALLAKLGREISALVKKRLSSWNSK